MSGWRRAFAGIVAAAMWCARTFCVNTDQGVAAKVERAVAPRRHALQAEARACLRFERRRLASSHRSTLGRSRCRWGYRGAGHLFVATLGYLRRPFVWAFRHER